MANKKVEIEIGIADRISKKLKTITSASFRAAQKLEKLKDSKKSLDGTLKKISAYKKAESNLESLRNESDALDTTMSKVAGFKKANKKLEELRTKTNNGAEGSKRLKKSFMQSGAQVEALTDDLKKLGISIDKLPESGTIKSKRLRSAFNQANVKARSLKTGLNDLGVNVNNLADEEKRLESQMDSTSGAIDKQKRKIDGFKILGKIGKTSARAAKFAIKATTAIAGVGVATGALFKRTFVDTAASFERFEAILTTVEGSSEKAKKSMDWVSDFAAKTPFELTAVTDAFVKMRAFGLEPTEGLLETLGNTASAMGKPLEQAVEAVADATTGEFERLKEFGIKASTEGKKAIFSFTDAAGEQRFKSVDKANRKQIQSTLEAIWNQKYKGAMELQSKTWSGMTSNVSDQWTRFQNKVMSKGVFDTMKNRLSGILGSIDEMEQNGSLDRIAERMANVIDGFLTVGYGVADVFGWIFHLVEETAREVAELTVGMGNFFDLVSSGNIGTAIKKLVTGDLIPDTSETNIEKFNRRRKNKPSPQEKKQLNDVGLVASEKTKTLLKTGVPKSVVAQASAVPKVSVASLSPAVAQSSGAGSIAGTINRLKIELVADVPVKIKSIVKKGLMDIEVDTGLMAVTQ